MAVLLGIVALVLIVAAGVALAPYLGAILTGLGLVAVACLLLAAVVYVGAWGLRLFFAVFGRPLGYVIHHWQRLTGPQPRPAPSGLPAGATLTDGAPAEKQGAVRRGVS
jgi:hypothetical protein